jgi:hypothetical protein
MGDRILDWLCDHVFPWFVIVSVVLLVVALILFGCKACVDSRAEHFSLRKDGWICTKAHQVSSTTYVMVDKVMIPIESASTVCDQWTAK